MTNPLRIFIGYDSRQEQAYQVCLLSLAKHTSSALNIRPLELPALRAAGLYTRKHTVRDGQTWDVISDAPMSTEFAISRFLVPHLCNYEGWALFCDGDFMWRADVAELFALAKDDYAVMVVKHNYIPPAGLKMDEQINTIYPRKLWSSMMLLNCGHPRNRALDIEYVNNKPGRDMHAFAWLFTVDIGSIPFEWNWLELEPKAVHFTHGTPDCPGHENVAYADEYRAFLR